MPLTPVTQGQQVRYRDVDGTAWPAVVLAVKKTQAWPQPVDLLVLGLSHRAQLLGSKEQKRLIKATQGSSDLVIVQDVERCPDGDEINCTWFPAA